MTLDVAGILRELYEADADKYYDGPESWAVVDGPLVAVAAGDDSWFLRFKEVIGEFHWTPAEALAVAAPQAKARSVICWAVPIAKPARQANCDETQVPSAPLGLRQTCWPAAHRSYGPRTRRAAWAGGLFCRRAWLAG